MGKYLLVYYGGKMAATPKEVEKSNMDWMNWFKSMGKSMVDMGAPTMPGKMVGGKPMTGDPVTGYSVIMADSMDAAMKMAKGAPGMNDGLMIAVYPMMDMMTAAQGMKMPEMAMKK